MRSLSFLVSRRWLLFALVVVLLAYATWWLGEWQFHRLDERKARNAVTTANLKADPVPADDVFGDGLSASEEWKRVTATGTYDAAHTLQIRYRTYEGNGGVEVVVPLVTADHMVLLVDRGWLGTDSATAAPDDVPAPPAGEITVTAWARADAPEDTAVDDADGVLSTRAVSSETWASKTGLTAYQGWAQLDEEKPAATAEPALRPAELPDLGNGPHFFYGLQWWFFGILAIFGFGYLAYDEQQVRLGKREARQTRSRKGDRTPD